MKLKPYYTVSPWEILKDESNEYKKIAKYMDCLIANKTRITRLIAKQLERYTGVSDRLWLGIQRDYDRRDKN
jgi:plasmid maintenance system antidote protein VapI